jgi:hypothetical protein
VDSFEAMAEMDADEKKLAIEKAQTARKSARRSDLAGMYTGLIAGLLRTLNQIEMLEHSLVAAGQFADEDLIGSNAYFSAEQLASARTVSNNLIESLRKGGIVEEFSRDALEAVVPGGATI